MKMLHEFRRLFLHSLLYSGFITRYIIIIFSLYTIVAYKIAHILYNISIMNCIGFALALCLPAYIVYILAHTMLDTSCTDNMHKFILNSIKEFILTLLVTLCGLGYSAYYELLRPNIYMHLIPVYFLTLFLILKYALLFSKGNLYKEVTTQDEN